MSSEVRLPRQYLSKKLEKFVKTISTRPIFKSDEKLKFYPYSAIRSEFRVTALWAHGSWARGALECGDLDLISSIQVLSGDVPSNSIAAFKIKGRIQRLQMAIGTPDKNSLELSIADAVLIWSDQKPNYKENIEKVRIDPLAGRFSRDYDILPVRLDQIRISSKKELDCILNDYQAGHIDWRWYDYPEDTGNLKQLSSWEKKFITDPLIQKIFPKIDNWVCNNSRSDFVGEFLSKTVYFTNGTKILMGKPEVPIWDFERLRISRIILAPHITKRGPNGFLVIERGKHHPLVRRFLELEIYAVVLDADYEYYLGGMFQRKREFLQFGICDFTPERAMVAASKANITDRKYTVRCLTGKSLLEYLSYFQAIRTRDNLIVHGPDQSLFWRPEYNNVKIIISFIRTNMKRIRYAINPNDVHLYLPTSLISQ